MSAEQGLSKQTIVFSAELGGGAVQVKISERNGEGWFLKQLMMEEVRGESMVEVSVHKQMDIAVAFETMQLSMESAIAEILAKAQGKEVADEFFEGLTAVGPGPQTLGMDVSYAQGFATNFDRAVQAGVKYCFIRACSGMSEKDPNFELNYAEAGRVGMLRGIYYYQYPEALATVGDLEDRTPEGQARRFARMLKGDAELGAVLDVEAEGLSPQEVQRFVDEFQKHDPYGRPIMIYTGGWYWNLLRGYAGDPVAWAVEHPLWVADYASDSVPVLPAHDYQVAVPDPWQRYDFHQWTAVGGPLIQHASPKLDLNHFPGTIEDLVAWSNVENAPASKAPLARKRVDAGDGLNVRAEPRLDGPKVATLANGSEIDVFEEGEWDYIKAGDTVGYVFSQLLSPF